jgi:hypothetical protein
LPYLSVSASAKGIDVPAATLVATVIDGRAELIVQSPRYPLAV